MRIRMRKNIGYPFVLLEENPSITNIEETTTKYGTKKLNVKTNLESEDLLYSFDGGTTWQKEPYKTFIKTIRHTRNICFAGNFISSTLFFPYDFTQTNI